MSRRKKRRNPIAGLVGGVAPLPYSSSTTLLVGALVQGLVQHYVFGPKEAAIRADERAKTIADMTKPSADTGEAKMGGRLGDLS